MALASDLIGKLRFSADVRSLKTTNMSKENAEVVHLNRKASPDGSFGLKAVSKNVHQLNTPAATLVLDPVPKVEVSPLEKIKSGFLKFKEYYKQEESRFKELQDTQTPPFLIIACADSRVDPCNILSLTPGDAFVIRNVANLVPPYNSNMASCVASAMEFAVLNLKIKHIMVIGHSRCAGVRALMGMEEDKRVSEFIEDWVVIGKDVANKVKNLRRNTPFDDQCVDCEKESVNQSLSNCLSFPFVREKVEAGELSLHGAYYDFVNGTFERWTKGLSGVEDYEKYE